MARSDAESQQDIVSAIADIRADTLGTDFAAFAARPAIVRSVLYSIAVMGRQRKTSALRSKRLTQISSGERSPGCATKSSTSIFGPIGGGFGTSSPMISMGWRKR